MNSLKVLVLVHHDCVPPQGATISQAEWQNWKTEFHLKKALKKLGHQAVFLGVYDDLEVIKSAIDQEKPDIVFNLLEEFNGQPALVSHVVAYLELIKMPYTGCNPQALSLGMDKAMSKKVLDYHEILTPSFFTVEKGKTVKSPKTMSYPMIVKSLCEEASLGISQDSIVHNSVKLNERVRFIHEKIGTAALVEEYIEGREFYVGVIGNKNLQVMPPWELDFGQLSRQGWPIATRNVKFNKNYCEKHAVKRRLATGLDGLLLKRVDQVSRQVYRLLKFNGYARLDFRLDKKGQLYLLEANPNAELARGECLANAALQKGLEYHQLVSKILSLGLSYDPAA